MHLASSAVHPHERSKLWLVIKTLRYRCRVHGNMPHCEVVPRWQLVENGFLHRRACDARGQVADVLEQLVFCARAKTSLAMAVCTPYSSSNRRRGHTARFTRVVDSVVTCLGATRTRTHAPHTHAPVLHQRPTSKVHVGNGCNIPVAYVSGLGKQSKSASHLPAGTC